SLLHEYAHQWYGDLVTPDNWPDLWMNESFAMYLQLLWSDEVGLLDYDATIAAWAVQTGASADVIAADVDATLAQFAALGLTGGALSNDPPASSDQLTAASLDTLLADRNNEAVSRGLSRAPAAADQAGAAAAAARAALPLIPALAAAGAEAEGQEAPGQLAGADEARAEEVGAQPERPPKARAPAPGLAEAGEGGVGQPVGALGRQPDPQGPPHTARQAHGLAGEGQQQGRIGPAGARPALPLLPARLRPWPALRRTRPAVRLPALAGAAPGPVLVVTRRSQGQSGRLSSRESMARTARRNTSWVRSCASSRCWTKAYAVR
ncbi:MAG: hypothetical protein LOD90_09285, partial [Symbiobacteriaceae bacterium]